MRARRRNAEKLVENCLDKGLPFWFVTTPDMIRRQSYPGPKQVPMWSWFTIDEFHETGLPEIKNVFPKAVRAIEAERKYALSGTPMGGKPIRRGALCTSSSRSSTRRSGRGLPSG